MLPEPTTNPSAPVPHDAASSCPPCVLLVEDNRDDVALIQSAFKRTGFDCRIRNTECSGDAIKYLSGEPPYADRAQYPLPNLLLVDLNLPGQSGLELLDWVQHQPELRRVRPVVLSGSSKEDDVSKALSLGARDYQVKPSDFRSFIRLAHDLELKWLNAAPGW